MGTIKRQGILNAVITYAGVVIGFFSLLFIQPMLLKPEELGLTRILIAGASLIATILPLGVSSITTRYFPYFRNPEKKHHGYFGFMLLFPLAGSLICGLAVYLLRDVIIAQYSSESPLFVRFFDLLLPFAIIMGLNMTLNAYSASLFRTAIISLFESIVTRILFIVLILFYYFGLFSLTEFMICFVLIYLLQSVVMVVYLWSVDRPSLKVDRVQMSAVGRRKMIIYGLLLTLTNISSVSLRHMDVVMLGHYGLAQVGVFSVAAYIALVIEIPLSSLERITHSKVAQAWAENDRDGIADIYRQSVKYLMLAGGMLFAGIICNVNDLLGLLPESYRQGAAVCIIASCGSFLNVSTGVNTSILFSSEKYRYGTALLAFLFVFALSLNIMLIPRFGMVGAALATSASAVIYNVLKYLMIRKFYGMQPYNLNSLKILLALAATLVCGYLIPALTANGIISIAVRSTAMVTVYGAMSYMMNIAPELYRYIPFLRKRA